MLVESLMCGMAEDSFTTYKKDSDKIFVQKFDKVFDSGESSYILDIMGDQKETQVFFWYMEDDLSTTKLFNFILELYKKQIITKDVDTVSYK